jgi:cyclic pyranopterin phosphate synthase
MIRRNGLFPHNQLTDMTQLIDRFGRTHDNLRISVTDRCNIRCVYCMPELVEFLPRAEILSFEELARLATVAASLGVTKIRITGGEPLVRHSIWKLISVIRQISGIREITLTTNAILLADQAAELKQAGLDRLNISLDTLDTGRFQTLTRRTGLEDVLRGIDAAIAAGFQATKINAVAIKGFSEPDIIPLASYARDKNLELRFIEYMPLDAHDVWQRGKVLLMEEMIATIEDQFGPLTTAPGQDPSAPATEFQYADTSQKIGFIASVSRPFCKSCNRIRITADGKLRNCLFAIDETDLRSLLRSGADDDFLKKAFLDSIAAKWEGHEINTARFIKPDRLMHSIGG